MNNQTEKIIAEEKETFLTFSCLEVKRILFDNYSAIQEFLFLRLLLYYSAIQEIVFPDIEVEKNSIQQELLELQEQTKAHMLFKEKHDKRILALLSISWGCWVYLIGYWCLQK